MNTKRYHEDPIYREKQKAFRRESSHKVRFEALRILGGKCMCCGYADIQKKIQGVSFLEIDHIAGGNGIGGICGGSLARLVVKDPFRAIGLYRVLCAGCNNAIEPNAKKCELHKEIGD